MRISRRFECALALFALWLVTSPACSSSPTTPDSGPCVITYPATGLFYGANLFAPGMTMMLQSDTTTPAYELAANLYEGSTLAFTMTLLAGDGGMTGVGSPWTINVDSDFRYSEYDATSGQQMFMSRLLLLNETKIMFGGTGQARIDRYECGAASPLSMTITWQP